MCLEIRKHGVAKDPPMGINDALFSILRDIWHLQEPRTGRTQCMSWMKPEQRIGRIWACSRVVFVSLSG